jgi:hypothetical protein
MDNKYFKFILIGAVILVWGGIIYRIIYGLSPGDAPANVRISMPKPEMRLTIDTFYLNADYTDPFLPEEDSVNIDSGSKRSNITPVSIGVSKEHLTQETVAAVIQFNGVIANPSKKKRVAIVTTQGKEFLVNEGDKIDNIRIFKIGKNSIYLFYKGEGFTIRKL